MLGLIIAVIVFNSAAFITNQTLTKNQIVHTWTFTIVLQMVVDCYLSVKYDGYWYFNKDVEWMDLPAFTLLGAPVIMLFLNWYPLQSSFFKRMIYIIFWSILILIYEVITLLPEPWGFFNYGWWKLSYSAICYPVLLLIELYYYQWVCKIEKIN